MHVDDTTPPVALRFDADNDPNTLTDGVQARVDGGEAGALLDAINVTYPAYGATLDAVADNLRTMVNTQQTAGVDLNGNPGVPFFDTATVGAKNFTLNAAVAADYNLVAAGAAGAGALDGENARLMANLVDANNGPDAQYREMINKLGIESQRSSRRVEIQGQISQQVDTSRESEAGVNLDEEQTNLIAFQRAYEGSAKVIQAIDEMTQTLISMIR